MNMTVRTKVVKIGHSIGSRIPRTLLEQAGLATFKEINPCRDPAGVDLFIIVNHKQAQAFSFAAC